MLSSMSVGNKNFYGLKSCHIFIGLANDSQTHTHINNYGANGVNDSAEFYFSKFLKKKKNKKTQADSSETEAARKLGLSEELEVFRCLRIR
jgi:hypothetical protein